MNKIDKFYSITFIFLLLIWLISTFYLSFMNILSWFFSVDPYISKNISASTFLVLMIMGLYNLYKGTSFEKIKNILNGTNQPTTGCSSCGKKKTKI